MGFLPCLFDLLHVGMDCYCVLGRLSSKWALFGKVVTPEIMVVLGKHLNNGFSMKESKRKLLDGQNH